jgi:hypothetical protein
LDLAEILTIRLECARCETAVIFKPDDWQDALTACPKCGGLWELPHVPGREPSGLQQLGTGLRLLLQQDKVVAKTGGEMPFHVKLEINDPTMAKYR